MRLDTYSTGNFDRGASQLIQAAWLLVSGLIVGTWLPGSRWRVLILKAFGATIGIGVVIKPKVKIKFPWRLSIGSHCWIGESVWIDNLQQVILEDHVCISQGSYLCTGSHDWTKESFDLITRPIYIRSHAWIGAKSCIAPGTEIKEGAVLSMGGIASGEIAPWTIQSGLYATRIKQRKIRES